MQPTKIPQPYLRFDDGSTLEQVSEWLNRERVTHRYGEHGVVLVPVFCSGGPLTVVLANQKRLETARGTRLITKTPSLADLCGTITSA